MIQLTCWKSRWNIFGKHKYRYPTRLACTYKDVYICRKLEVKQKIECIKISTRNELILRGNLTVPLEKEKNVYLCLTLEYV